MKGSQQKTHKTSISSRYRFLLTGFSFSIIILSPSVDQWVNLLSNFKSTEKRILTPLPAFTFPHVQTYIYQFNQYYKENFGWRNTLFYQYSHLKYKVMGVSPLPQKVILGKNNWFYPGNNFANITDQHQGLLPISPNTLQKIARQLTSHQQYLAANGIKLYLLIAPDSYTIYPENLPLYLQKKSFVSNFDYLKQYLEKYTTVPFIDVRAALRNDKSKHITYYQTDTHWNEYGALLATFSLVNRIRLDLTLLPEPKLKEYTIQLEKGFGGDLVTMLALNREITDSVNYKIKMPVYLESRQIEKVESEQMGLPAERFSSISKKSAKLLLIGDSFSFSLARFLPGYFAESYFVRSHSFKHELIRAEKPDVVIIEIVERNLADLAKL